MNQSIPKEVWRWSYSTHLSSIYTNSRPFWIIFTIRDHFGSFSSHVPKTMVNFDHYYCHHHIPLAPIPTPLSPRHISTSSHPQQPQNHFYKTTSTQHLFLSLLVLFNPPHRISHPYQPRITLSLYHPITTHAYMHITTKTIPSSPHV